jgi:vancomycin resistance protein YoaR
LVKRSTIVTVVGLAAAVVLVLGSSVLVSYEITSWNRVKPGVAVLDVPVGGLTLHEAQAKLEPTTLAILDQPLQVQLDQHTWTTSARQLGVHLDPGVLAQSAYAVGRDSAPLSVLQTQVDVLRDGVDVPVSGQADGAELDNLVSQIAAQVDHPAVDAHLALHAEGTIEFTPSATGLQVDQVATRGAIAQALVSGQTQVTPITQTLQPAVTTDQVSAAHDQLQKVLNPQPLQLTAAEYARTLAPSDIQQLITLNQPSGSDPASVTVNTDALQPVVDDITHSVNQDAVNARFTWNGKQLSVIRPSQPGRSVDAQATTDALTAAILAGARSVDLPVATDTPSVTADDGAKLGIHDLIESSTTSFAGSVPEKAYNIKLAAQRLNGVVVPPGATFSFNDEVGPTTLEAGFQWGFGLTTGDNGGAHTVPSVAGGICQVATTLFQPVFWSGYQIEERYWHLYWIPAYTSKNVVGLDATVDEDAGLDFKWINPTNNYVLIQSSTDADHVTFSLYGTKPDWKVQVDPAVITNRVSPDTTPEVEAEPLLPWGRVIPVETARDGFTVVISRHVLAPDGSTLRDLSLKSIYQPGRNVTLVGSGNAPNSSAVTSAVNRLLGSQKPAAAAAPAPVPATPARAAVPAAAPLAAAPAAPATFQTGNGPRTLDQIREELRNAGWGGGSDQDAVATYRRLADAAH